MLFARRQSIAPDTLVRHMDGRLGRVLAVLDGALPQASVRWFAPSGPYEETLPLGYITATMSTDTDELN